MIKGEEKILSEEYRKYIWEKERNYIQFLSGVLKCTLFYASRLFHAVDVNGVIWEDEFED